VQKIVPEFIFKVWACQIFVPAGMQVADVPCVAAVAASKGNGRALEQKYSSVSPPRSHRSAESGIPSTNDQYVEGLCQFIHRRVAKFHKNKVGFR
jgi:hypothetical protein